MKIPVKQYWALLVNYLKPQGGMVSWLAVLVLSNIALQLVSPQIIRYFIDTAQAGAAAEVLLRAALLFLGLALVQQVVAVLSRYVSERVAWTSTNAMRVDLAEHCLRLDLSFHNAHAPGEMIERIDGDVTALSNFFSQFVIQLLGNAILLVGIVVMLFREDWRVGLALSGFSLLSLFIMGRFRNIAVPHWTAERQASAEMYSFLEERLAGTEDIRANGAEAYVMRHFYRLMREMLRKSLRAGLMINVLLNTTQFLFAAGVAAAFAIGAYLFDAKVVTIGTVYIIFHYTSMLERPINTITHQVGDLQRAGAGVGRVREMLETHSKVQERPPSLGVQASLPGGPLAVAFQSVTFGYDDSLAHNGNGASKNGGADSDGKEPPEEGEKEIVLHDLSFSLHPGRVLGLLGRTGSGKTTLTRLVFRFFDPDEGSVQIAGGSLPGMLDIRDLSLEVLRLRVGMVTQNIQLFHASVRDNLTFFDSSIPDERIQEVIEALGLSEWYQALPEGLDTVLESGGGGLSAGEAQLLAFTRIFLKDPGLVILDEASSRLDPATEALIERAVDRLVQDRTAIIIAHRLGTVQRADEIMILEAGRIQEHGSRVALASDPNSRFYGLLRTGLEEVLV